MKQEVTNKPKNLVEGGVSCFHKCLRFLPRQPDIVPLMEQQRCHTLAPPIRFGVGNEWRARTRDLLTAPSLCESHKRPPPHNRFFFLFERHHEAESDERMITPYTCHLSLLRAAAARKNNCCLPFPPPLRFVFYLQFVEISSHSSDSLLRICFCGGRRARKKKCLWI